MDNKALGAVPVDADGAIVPFTTRYMYDEDNIRRNVNSFQYSPIDCTWRVLLDNELYEVSEVTVAGQDTWRWIDEDLSNALREVGDHGSAVAYFNNRCKLSCDECEFSDLGNERESNACSVHTMLLDIRKRVKKLCGEEA